MAITTLSVNPQKITVSGTDTHEIDFKNMVIYDDHIVHALIEFVSGTSVQIAARGTLNELSASLTATNNKMVLVLKRIGPNIKYKGGAGNEVFIVTIID
jgi:hypothetical protein